MWSLFRQTISMESAIFQSSLFLRNNNTYPWNVTLRPADEFNGIQLDGSIESLGRAVARVDEVGEGKPTGVTLLAIFGRWHVIGRWLFFFSQLEKKDLTVDRIRSTRGMRSSKTRARMHDITFEKLIVRRKNTFHLFRFVIFYNWVTCHRLSLFKIFFKENHL